MAILSRTLLTSSAIAILSTLPALAHPSQHPDSLSKRQGAVTGYAGFLLKGAIFGKQAECCDNDQCYTLTDNGGTWQACWDAPPQGGGYYWT